MLEVSPAQPGKIGAALPSRDHGGLKPRYRKKNSLKLISCQGRGRSSRMRSLKVLFIEPFMQGSHATVVKNYREHSQHEIFPLTLRGKHWTKNLCSGAAKLSKRIDQDPSLSACDVVIATDLMQQGDFYTLQQKHFQNTAKIFFAHEHQFVPANGSTYDKDKNVKFSNIVSALCVDKCFFLSPSSMNEFISGIREYLNEAHVRSIEAKSESIDLGVEFSALERYKSEKSTDCATVLWNHRLGNERNPLPFFRALKGLSAEGLNFRVIIAADISTDEVSSELQSIIGQLGDKVIHAGFVKGRRKLAKLCWKSNISVSTSLAESFGLSVAESIYCKCWPVLPNRLTYPQFIPDQYHGDHLYNGDEDLIAKLRWAIMNFRGLKTDVLQKRIAEYSWEKIAPKWDEAVYRAYQEYHQPK
jgi:glycosyltransferase involved in cell wall biosynthesis